MLMQRFSFLILWCCSTSLMAQSFDAMVSIEPNYQNEFNLASLKENQLFISMPFAKQTVLNPEQKKKINEKVLIKLELVYTKYRKASSFNQIKLNESRLIALQKLAPLIFENRFWDFDLISQTNGNSRNECDKMFHGFVLTFRPNSTPNTLDLEANYLENLAVALYQQDSVDADNKNRKYVIKTHYDLKIGYLHDTIWFKDTVKPVPPPDFFYNQTLYKDSTVLNAFDRNTIWKNFIVVTDVTGSMSPYSAQVFVWLKAQAQNKKAAYFVFFNDGDQKESAKKKPLETKGVYVAENKDLETVIKAATKCMRNGSGGGENLENDVEAIIEGLKYYPNADEIILVADNYESMRDYEYFDKIKKPVHVILCGSENRINIQYLNLARQTKGTVHTVKSDVMNLQNIKEGEHLFIDENEYLYQNGKFHAVYSLLDKYK